MLILTDKQGEIFELKLNTYLTGLNEELVILEHSDGKRLVSPKELETDFQVIGEL